MFEEVRQRVRGLAWLAFVLIRGRHGVMSSFELARALEARGRQER